MSKVSLEKEKKEKEVALEFFKYVMEGKPKAARHLFTENCKHHNPYVAQGMDALLASMAEVQKMEPMPEDIVFDLEHVLVDGDLVAVHTVLKSESKVFIGLRQIHLFRFKGDKVAEYWDITQTVPEEAPHPKRMF